MGTNRNSDCFLGDLRGTAWVARVERAKRAKRVRNATMIAFLSLCPIRSKNFAALEIGKTFRNIAGVWWITLPSQTTKSRNPLERQVPSLITPIIDKYINVRK